MTEATPPPTPGRGDPKLLNRKAMLEVYEAIINRSITAEYHQALVHEAWEHMDAQGRLLARAGNLILKGFLVPRLDNEVLEVLAEIKRGMS